MRISATLLLVVVVGSCSSPAGAPIDSAGGTLDAAVDASTPIDGGPLPSVTITSTVNSTRFVVREHMLAAGEMQISGEPLAQSMGRDLGGYSRDLIPTDIYNDPNLGLFWIDVPGFSTGVESYEYSKQPMNNLASESGAGTSLAYAPLVDTDNATGSAATAHLADLVQHYAAASNAFGKFVFAPGTFPINNPIGDVNPNGVGSARQKTRSVGRESGRLRTSSRASIRRSRRRATSTCFARSARTMIRVRSAARSAPTTSATRPRCTCRIARRRSIQPSRRAPTDSRAGSTACGR